MPNDRGISRRLVILGGLTGLSRPVQANTVSVRLRDGQLSLEAPQFHFLHGRAVDRLHDGHALAYEFQLSVRGEAHAEVLRRAIERFFISYDLWEEKFVVAAVRAPGRPVSHLAAPAAEAWCLDRILLSTAGIDADRQLWIRLDVRAEDISSIAPSGDATLDLSTLIDLFSRPGRDRALRWSVETGPVQLAQIPREEWKR